MESVPDLTGPLPLCTPAEAGIDPKGIVGFVDAVEAAKLELHSFMLLRRGQVAAEGWWQPYRADRPHMMFSASKSFTSTAIGIAVDEGRLSIDDTVVSFFPELVPESPSDNLKAMRVRDLLAMATGHESEPSLLTSGDEWVKSFLACPVPHTPGTHFVYNTPATYVLSAILKRATGEDLLDFLQPRLFGPLGIENPTWQRSPEGISTGGYGLSIRTEDLAKFGQMYLQSGRWGDRQLVSAHWVSEATAFQVSNGDDPENDWNQGYGYQFWRCRHNAYRGDGAFGQFIVVMPEQEAVLAITSGLQDMHAVLSLVWEHLLSAIDRPSGGEVSTAALEERLASLVLPIPHGSHHSAAAVEVNGRTFRCAENTLGIETLRIGFHPDHLRFEVTGNPESFTVDAGLGRWIEEGELAACANWVERETLSIRVAYRETPWVNTYRLRVDGDSLVLEFTRSCSFGPTDAPTITATAETR